jgi:hypothetical protein
MPMMAAQPQTGASLRGLPAWQVPSNNMMGGGQYQPQGQRDHSRFDGMRGPGGHQFGGGPGQHQAFMPGFQPVLDRMAGQFPQNQPAAPVAGPPMPAPAPQMQMPGMGMSPRPQIMPAPANQQMMAQALMRRY